MEVSAEVTSTSILEGNLEGFSTKVCLTTTADKRSLCVTFLLNGITVLDTFLPLPLSTGPASSPRSGVTPKRKRIADSTIEEEISIKRCRIDDTEENQAEISISCLPHEILEDIFVPLPLHTISTVTRVSKDWQMVVERDGFWKRFFSYNYGHIPVVCGTWKEKVRLFAPRWQWNLFDKGRLYWSTALGIEVDENFLKKKKPGIHWSSLGRLAGFAGNMTVTSFMPPEDYRKKYLRRVFKSAIRTGDQELYNDTMATAVSEGVGTREEIFAKFVYSDDLLDDVTAYNFERILKELVGYWRTQNDIEPEVQERSLVKALSNTQFTAHAQALLEHLTLRPELELAKGYRSLEVVLLILRRMKAASITWLNAVRFATDAVRDTPHELRHFPALLDALLSERTPATEDKKDWFKLLQAFLRRIDLWRSLVCGDVKDPDDEEQNPVLKSLRKLLRHSVAMGVDLNGIENDRWGLLELSLREECPPWVVRTLIEEGCTNVNACSPEEPTPLMWAVEQGRRNMVDLLRRDWPLFKLLRAAERRNRSK